MKWLGNICFVKFCQSKDCRRLLVLWVRKPLRRVVFDTTLCDKVGQWLATGRWFSPGTAVSSTNKTVRHDITEILLKVALTTITLTKPNPSSLYQKYFSLFSLQLNWFQQFKYQTFKNYAAWQIVIMLKDLLNSVTLKTFQLLFWIVIEVVVYVHVSCS